MRTPDGRCGRGWYVANVYCHGRLSYHFCRGLADHHGLCLCVHCGRPYEEKQANPEPRRVTDWGSTTTTEGER